MQDVSDSIDMSLAGLAPAAWKQRLIGQVEPLEALLVRWAGESPKDFRTHRSLAWWTEGDQRLELAAEHYARALKEEPQRAELRQRRLTVSLSRSRRCA